MLRDEGFCFGIRGLGFGFQVEDLAYVKPRFSIRVRLI